MRLLATGYWLLATGYRLQATATRQRSDRTERSGAAATSLQPRDGADGGGDKVRLLATGYWLLATGYRLLATGYRLQATATWQRSDRTEGSGAAATSLQPRDGADGGGDKVRLLATGYRLQATGYWLQATSYSHKAALRSYRRIWCRCYVTTATRRS